jgi:hypothetical protein
MPSAIVSRADAAPPRVLAGHGDQDDPHGSIRVAEAPPTVPVPVRPEVASFGVDCRLSLVERALDPFHRYKRYEKSPARTGAARAIEKSVTAHTL